MKIENKTNPKNDYGEERNIQDIKYIVIQSLDNKATPHYHVIRDKALQIIPDNHISDSVNGGRLNRFGIYHGICTKYNSLSIGIIEDEELCIHLILALMQRYKISTENVLRKFDITGEANPEIWIDSKKWQDIKDKLHYAKCSDD